MKEIMIRSEQQIISALASKFKFQRPEGFTGIGLIICCGESDSLPLSPLLDSSLSNFENPKDSISDIINFLFDISVTRDQRHDGFHIIDPEQGLVAISQYFSPIIPSDFEGTTYNVGSRFRAAQYGSLYNQVSSIVTINQQGTIFVARKGIVEKISL